MKSSFKTLVIVLAAVLSVFMLSSAALAATTYDATKDFGGTQKNQWSFEINDGSGFKIMQHYKEDWHCWLTVEDPGPTNGPWANVCDDGGKLTLHPDKNPENSNPIDNAVAWTAPADGSVSIPATEVKHDSNNSTGSSVGTKVWIELNGKKYNETALKVDGNATLSALTLNVKQGDKVYFAANNNGRDGYNNTRWPITVSFDEGAAAAESSDAGSSNPKTGDNGFVLYGVLAAVALAGIVMIMRRRAVH